jgi:hypothetical protein
VGILGTSAGTEPIVPDYLRGQVFNREVPLKEEEFLAHRISSRSYSPTWNGDIAGTFASYEPIISVDSQGFLLTSGGIKNIRQFFDWQAPGEYPLWYSLNDENFFNRGYPEADGITTSYVTRYKFKEIKKLQMIGLRFIVFRSLEYLETMPTYEPVDPPQYELSFVQAGLFKSTKEKPFDNSRPPEVVNRSGVLKPQLFLEQFNYLHDWREKFVDGSTIYRSWYRGIAQALEYDLLTGLTRSVPRID